jgi:hypothetical protein
MTSDNRLQRWVDLCDSYKGELKKDLKRRLELFPLNLDEEEVFAVVGGLMARIVTITGEFGLLPGAQSREIGPLFLRAAADAYISLAWILESPSERSKKFIEHGLGQTKLMIEHRKERLRKEGEKPDEDKVVIALEGILNSQKWDFLVEVDLGSWSGKNARQMSEEAGLLDFYNMFYVPHSQTVHNTWFHLRLHNLKPSANSLHRNHLVPVINDAPRSLYIFLEAVHLMQMGFDLLDKFYFPEKKFINREEWFEEELAKLGDRFRAESKDRENEEDKPTQEPE